MDIYFSAKTTEARTLSNSEWTPVQFRLDEIEADNQSWFDVDSGLVIPRITAVGLIAGMAQFDVVARRPQEATSSYSARVEAGQTGIQFCRDPLGHPDTTATQDHRNTNGVDCLSGSWPLIMRPKTPLGIQVYTSIVRSLKVAEFKVWIP